jgi:pilus assembly protein Flp/PilA
MQEERQKALATMRRMLRDEQGASAIEYAMIAAGIAVAIVATVNALGGTVQGLYQSILTALTS